jgi:hypothetical protein
MYIDWMRALASTPSRRPPIRALQLFPRYATHEERHGSDFCGLELPRQPQIVAVLRIREETTFYAKCSSALFVDHALSVPPANAPTNLSADIASAKTRHRGLGPSATTTVRSGSKSASL